MLGTSGVTAVPSRRLCLRIDTGALMTDKVRYKVLHGASVGPQDGMAAFRERRAPVCPE